jgi:fructokinase
MTTTPAPEADGARALVVGESLIDVVRRLDGSVDEHPGGSPMNVAIGLGRLGRPVDLLTWFGQDARGTALREHIAESAVRVVEGSDGAASTSVAVATLDATGAATYTFELDWQVPPRAEQLDDAVVVHSSTIGAALAPGGEAVLDLLSRARTSATVTYDPNVRPALLGDGARALVERLVELADVVKVSDEDLAWCEPGSTPGAVAARWASRGPGLVVVTHGAEGVLAMTSAGLTVTVPSRRVVVADTVGAGDSFMSGLIDGLWTAGLLGADRREALGLIDESTLIGILERCAEIAGITVSRAGANPPWARELSPQSADV